MIKLEKIKGKMLLNRIAVGSPSAWIELLVPAGEQILILDNAQKELRNFDGRAKNKENPYHFEDPVMDFLDPNKYELVLIPEGPALCIYGYTYGWTRLAELSGKYYVYRNMDVQEGEAGLVFVEAWCDTSKFCGNDKLAKFSDNSKVAPVPGGLVIGSPAVWFFINGLGIQDFAKASSTEIEVVEKAYTAGCHNKIDELCKNGYELLRSIEGPNIGLYGMDKDGKIHLIQHLEGDYFVLRKLEAKTNEPKIVFVRDLSQTKYVRYTGSAKLTADLSAAGYALSLD